MTRMHLLLLLDRLEELVTKSPRFAGRNLVPADDAMELLDKIRYALPEEIRQAESLMAQREEYMRQAAAEAERIRTEVETYVNESIADHIIVERAQDEAERLVRKAEEAAVEIEAEAHQYAHQILEQLEEMMEKSLRVIRKGKDELLQSKKF